MSKYRCIKKTTRHVPGQVISENEYKKLYYSDKKHFEEIVETQGEQDKLKKL